MIDQDFSEIIPHQRHERIVKELELCQAHLDTSYARSWQSGAIILAGALASLVLMLQIGASDLAGAIASTGFALGAVVVLSVWLLYLQRETGFQKVSIHRSRYLEEQLKMRRELLISAFDELAEQDPSRTAYAQLTDRERKDMDEVYEKVYRFRLPFVTPGGTTDTLYRIGFAVMVGWVFVVVWRWLIYAGVID